MEQIESLKEAELNAIEFNRLKRGSNSEAWRRFGRFFHWYYFPKLDLFAPSKFVGYKDTTIENYVGQGHGGETQEALSKWFRKLAPTSKEYRSLKEKLKSYGRDLGKSIGKRTFEGTGGIYVPSNKYSTSIDIGTLVEDLRRISRQNIDSTTKKALINARVGQGLFRSQVLAIWGQRCAVTGSSTIDAIRASHIKPWRSSSNEERLDPNNGLPLIASLDSLFDAGFISFDGKGTTIVSGQLSSVERSIFSVKNRRLQKRSTELTTEFLAYHRQNVFRK